jgi:hypothetical protein
MLDGNIRFCDICQEEIPKGDKYRSVTLRPEGAAMLLSAGDPDLIPTWKENPDGTVTLDVCNICTLSMDNVSEIKHFH